MRAGVGGDVSRGHGVMVGAGCVDGSVMDELLAGLSSAHRILSLPVFGLACSSGFLSLSAAALQDPYRRSGVPVVRAVPAASAASNRERSVWWFGDCSLGPHACALGPTRR